MLALGNCSTEASGLLIACMIVVGWSKLLEMDFGEPLGQAVEAPPNVFTRHYSKVSPVVLDCNSGKSTFGTAR